MRSIVEVGASVPAFLGKLWKLVNDSETDHLISWSPGGKTFFIKNQADFARSLLPQYYKHNNMASFIRQLNMYGFHKITSVENGGLRYEKDEIEFTHPCFMKGHAYLLEHIKRKIANPKSMMASSEGGEKLLVKPELMNKVLADVKSMKGKQESMDAKFSVMKQENEALWREVALLRQKHMKQQQIVNNLIQFLMSLVQPARGGNAHGVKRRYQLMINDAEHASNFKNPKLERDLLEDLQEEALEDGPTIHELAHDDAHPSEDSASPLDPRHYVTVEIPRQSPQQPLTPAQYQVTMEDGEDAEIVGSLLCPQTIGAEQVIGEQSTSPLVTSPADAALMSPPLNASSSGLIDCGQFSIAPTDMRLPADIFASDDSATEAAVAPELLSTNPPATTTKDLLLPNDNALNSIFVQPQMLKIKQEAPEPTKKTKKTSKQQLQNVDLNSIKTELMDSNDWTLAMVNNNPALSRERNMNIRDYGNNNEDRSSKYPTIKNMSELDDHLDTMQSDLESLRELLRSDNYSFDANTLLGVSNCEPYLFGQDDPLYGLNLSNMDDRTNKASNAQEDNQLMSYTGSVPDFGDFSLTEDEVAEDPLEDPLLGSTLNTPQVTLGSPFGANK